MSQQQLDAVVAEINACFGAWTAQTPLAQMREDWDALSSRVPSPIPARHTPVDAGGVPALWIEAPGAAPDRVIVYLHGGGYVFGGPRSHGALAAQYSHAAQARVLFLDYRLAPEHPFPAALQDSLAAWRWLLAQGVDPARTALAGDSAGGGLTLASLQAYRDAGLPLPACAATISPWVDLEGLGASFTEKAEVDPMVGADLIRMLVPLILPQGQVRDPRIAPIYGDFRGLPPLLIHVGERERLLDDARRVAACASAAGVKNQLEIWPGMVHVWHAFCPRLDEGVQALDQLGAFVRQYTA